jgi:hypothetical protein
MRARTLVPASLGLQILLGLGCSVGPKPIIEKASPLNGTTAINVSLQPQVTMASGSAVNDTGSRRVVLYDITGGAHKSVAADVLVEGTTITYQPKASLAASHEFELDVEEAVVNASDFEQLDGSESPEEKLTWPYALRFSTKSRPRVRAAYLEISEGASRVLVKFSQSMEPTTTGKAISILDGTTKSSLPKRAPIWTDTAMTEVRVELTQTLTSSGLYILQVAGTAVASDGTKLDGNDNGTPGESSDSFSAQFTGIQTVIASRLTTKN